MILFSGQIDINIIILNILAVSDLTGHTPVSTAASVCWFFFICRHLYIVMFVMLYNGHISTTVPQEMETEKGQKYVKERND